MSHKLAFETAPYDQLCNCLTVELAPEQERLIDAWPEKGQSIVKAAMKKRHRIQHVFKDKGIFLVD